MEKGAGINIFRGNYSNIYSTFEPIINNSLVDEEKIGFFDNLVYMYGLVKFEDNKKKLNECRNKAYSLIRGKHPFFTFLFYYGPSPYRLMPPCVNELEEALGSNSIIFESKEGTINSLRENGKFWYTYLVLEVAVNLVKEGCQVRVLHRDRSQGKYPDLEVVFKEYNFNIEVSNRFYHLTNKRTMFNALRNKIVGEAEQLPENGINIIILCMSNALMFRSKNNPENLLNVFDLDDIVYGEPGSEQRGGIILTFGKPRKDHKKPKRKLILETFEELRHIGALVIWYHGQLLLENLGKQTRLIVPYAREGFPQEIKEIFYRIQRRDIKRR